MAKLHGPSLTRLGDVTYPFVMAGLVPATQRHTRCSRSAGRAAADFLKRPRFWVPGTSPGMTVSEKSQGPKPG